MIAPGLMGQAAEHLLPALGESVSKIIVITNPTVRKLWERPLLDSFKQSNFEPAILEMKDGERHKRMASVEELAAGLVKLGADRRSAIVALGGGVVGDGSVAVYARHRHRPPTHYAGGAD